MQKFIAVTVLLVGGIWFVHQHENVVAAQRTNFAVNWKMCDAHLGDVDAQTHYTHRIEWRVQWLQSRTVAVTPASGNPIAGMTDEDLRFCMEIK